MGARWNRVRLVHGPPDSDSEGQRLLGSAVSQARGGPGGARGRRLVLVPVPETQPPRSAHSNSVTFTSTGTAQGPGSTPSSQSG